MKRKRAPRLASQEDWAIVPDGERYAVTAELRNLSDTGALFQVDFEIELHQRVTVCRWSSSGELPTANAVLSHPNRRHGTVVRCVRHNLCAVRFDAAPSRQPAKGIDSFFIETRQMGFDVVIKATGVPDIEKFAKLHDVVKEKAKIALRMLIDLSEVKKIPQMGCSIISSVLERLANKNRVIATVNCEVLCPGFTSETSPNGRLRHFPTRRDAEAYLEQNPVDALVIEDDRVSLRIIEQYLASMKVKAFLANTAAEAIERLNESVPDFILLDFHLPDLSGAEAVKRIRDTISPYSIPIIVITADANRASVAQSVTAKVSGYVVKPFNETLLSKTIIQSITA